MSEGKPFSQGVLYVISCANSSAFLVPDVVKQAQEMGWEVCVITTPLGTRFNDLPLLEQLTGYPVRSEYKRPEEPDVLPPADALVLFPGTFNTINKWALGIADTLALDMLCEYLGLHKPIVAVPCFRTGGWPRWPSCLLEKPRFSHGVWSTRDLRAGEIPSEESGACQYHP